MNTSYQVGCHISNEKTFDSYCKCQCSWKINRLKITCGQGELRRSDIFRSYPFLPRQWVSSAVSSESLMTGYFFVFTMSLHPERQLLSRLFSCHDNKAFASFIPDNTSGLWNSQNRRGVRFWRYCCISRRRTAKGNKSGTSLSPMCPRYHKVLLFTPKINRRHCRIKHRWSPTFYQTLRYTRFNKEPEVKEKEDSSWSNCHVSVIWAYNHRINVI